MLVKNLLEMTITEAEKAYKEHGTTFIIKDGKLKGMSKEVR